MDSKMFADMIRNGLRDQQRDPPLFDWRNQLRFADVLIAAVKQPRPPQIGSRRSKPSRGVDLSEHRESLAKFLAELGEEYLNDCDNFKERNGPDRPSEENKVDEVDAEKADAIIRAYEAAGWKPDDSPSYFDETYRRGRGNPGHNRTQTELGDRGPPIEPARKNYSAIEHWWTSTTGKKFTPSFAAPASADVEPEPFDRNNPAARFLILILKYLDKKYDAANARGIYHTIKKQRARRRRRPKE